MRLFFKACFAYLAVFLCALNANELEYSLIKKGVDDNNTLLVIGGIQGDEPGGFLAANLLANEYKIIKGSLWVVPNLNFNSIINNNRGSNGDMNRKFEKIDKKDPDFKTVTDIKRVISDANVSLIVHLHDGSGFYRPTFINELENPRRWGNSCIIDQDVLKGAAYGDLLANATRVANTVNKNIKINKHLYHVKNTHTAEKGGDKSMLKSLTYFAITKGKAAYANEASKSLKEHTRVFYHLLALEEYMRIAGIEFTRDFKLSENSVKKILEKEKYVNLNNDKFFLSLAQPRARINYVPMQKDTKLDYNSTDALLAIVENAKARGNFDVYYGNKLLTKLKPQYFEYSNTFSSAPVQIDDKDEIVTFGTKVRADKSILIKAQDNVRVNVIGYENKSKTETDIKIHKSDIIRSFSIDKNGKIFRVEFYEQQNGKKDKYLGMFLVEFSFLDSLKAPLVAGLDDDISY